MPDAADFKRPSPHPANRRVIWLGEQEAFSWGVTAWASLAAAVVVGSVVRVLTRNRVPRSA